MSAWQLLKSVADAPLINVGSGVSPAPLLAQPLADELLRLLQRRNGFYAFGGALLVRGLGDCVRPMAAEAWNGAFQELYEGARGLWLFSEDLFGGQFALSGGSVVYLSPETFDAEQFAPGLEGWARRLTLDTDMWTGRPLLATWVEANGRLATGRRLIASRPFVLGGRFEISNLRSCDEMEVLRLYAALARQLGGVADGDYVKIVKG